MLLTDGIRRLRGEVFAGAGLWDGVPLDEVGSNCATLRVASSNSTELGLPLLVVFGDIFLFSFTEVLSFTVVTFAGSGLLWDGSPATASCPLSSEFVSEVSTAFFGGSVDQNAQDDPAAAFAGGGASSMTVSRSQSFSLTGICSLGASVTAEGAAVDHKPNHEVEVVGAVIVAGVSCEVSCERVSVVDCLGCVGCDSIVGGCSTPFDSTDEGSLSRAVEACKDGLVSQPPSQPEDVAGRGASGPDSGAFSGLEAWE